MPAQDYSLYLDIKEVVMSDDAERLLASGMRVTSARRHILQYLEQAKQQHLRAEDIHSALQGQGISIGLATVYRTLAQFEAAGIIIRHHFEGDHSVYELDSGEHHDHLVCAKCGIVKEFVDDIIELRQEAVAKENGFKITDHQMTIYGVCAKCQ